MYTVTQLQGGRADLEQFKRRIRRSYGMERLTLKQHECLLQSVARLEGLLDQIEEENNNGQAESGSGEATD